MNLSPAYLFIGPATSIGQHALTFIEPLILTCNSCRTCSSCTALKEHRHHSMLWVTPEKMYTREILEPMLHILKFNQPTSSIFFIVLEHADLLTTICANALLKPLEEPPQGYHFILLSTTGNILPTLRSRCVVREFEGTFHEEDNILFQFLCNPLASSLHAFTKELEKVKPTEIAVVSLVEQALGYWLARSKSISADGRAMKCAYALTACLEQRPMPGSAKIFLRNAFLQLCHMHSLDTK